MTGEDFHGVETEEEDKGRRQKLMYKWGQVLLRIDTAPCRPSVVIFACSILMHHGQECQHFQHKVPSR